MLREVEEQRAATKQVLWYERGARVKWFQFLAFFLFQGFRVPLPSATDTQQVVFTVITNNAARVHCSKGVISP